MRVVSLIIAILGLAVLVFGIMFIVQAGSAEQEVADSIAPLPLDRLDAQYNKLKSQYNEVKDTGASVDVNNLLANKIGMGLARANVGTAALVRTNGIVDIILGAGLVLAGLALYRSQSAG